MREPPQPRTAGVISRDMAVVLGLSSVMTGATHLVIVEHLLRNGVALDVVRSFAFVSLGLTSTVVVLCMRSFRRSIVTMSPFSNPWMLPAVASSLVLLALPFAIPGLAARVGLAPLPMAVAPLLALLVVLQVLATEIAKLFLVATPRR